MVWHTLAIDNKFRSAVTVNIRIVFTQTNELMEPLYYDYHCCSITVSNLTAVTAVISDVRERSPAIISCTVVVISTVSDEHTVNITWSKDDHQLHSNSEISIVSANLTKHTYQSNLTIHVLEASDIGLYSCLATTTLSESSNQLASSVMSSIYLDMEGMIHLSVCR